jgi:hypothetical protein
MRGVNEPCSVFFSGTPPVLARSAAVMFLVFFRGWAQRSRPAAGISLAGLDVFPVGLF